MELQEVIDKQSREQGQMKERLAALSSHVAELEEDLDTARKDLIKSEEANTKLQRDAREVRAPGSSRVGIVLGVQAVSACSLSLSLPVVFDLWVVAYTRQTEGRCATGRPPPGVGRGPASSP